MSIFLKIELLYSLYTQNRKQIDISSNLYLHDLIDQNLPLPNVQT